MKKHFTLLLTAMLCTLLAVAQVPQGVNFQGIARDNNGLALAQGTQIGLRLSVLQGSATGSTVYSEEYPSVTLERGGIFNVVLGKGTPITGTFSGINWQGGSKFMRVEMRQGTSGSYTALSTTEIMSVPYAQTAAKAGWLDYLIVEDRKPSGTSGGGGTTLVWNTRSLNTGFPSDTSSGGNIILFPNTGKVQLKPGTYYIDGYAPAFCVNRHRAAIYDDVTGDILLLGSSSFSPVFNSGSEHVLTNSEIKGFIKVINPVTTIVLKHYIQNLPIYNGSSLGASVNIPGVQEQYSRLVIQKIQ